MWAGEKPHGSKEAGLIVKDFEDYWVPDGFGSFARDMRNSVEMAMQGRLDLSHIEEAYFIRPDGRVQRFFGKGFGSNILRADSEHFKVVKNPDILLPLEELTELEKKALRFIEEAEEDPVTLERTQALYNWCCLREEFAVKNTFEGAVQRAHARSMIHIMDEMIKKRKMPTDWKKRIGNDEEL
uniref:Sigma-70 family RNA polymerase sigma factor n=1 Tax=Steinernema glaseri TaxID=37863 RepID=A0A1I8AEK2_9BILA